MIHTSLRVALILLTCAALSLGAYASSEPVTLEVWFQQSEEGLFPHGETESRLQLFHEAFPNVRVEMEFSVGLDEYLTRVAGGIVPDVYSPGDNIPEFAAKGYLEPLDSFLSRSDLSPEDFWSQQLIRNTFRGELFGLPLRAVPHMGLAYNTDHLQQSGLEPAITIADLDLQASRLLQRRSDGTITRLGFVPWEASAFHNAFLIWSLAHGGSMWDADSDRLTVDNPNNVSAVEWIVSHTSNQTLSEYQQLRRAAGNHLGLFGGGSLSYLLLTPPQVSRILEEYPETNIGVTYPPYKVGSAKPQATTFIAGPSIGIPKNAAHPDEAWAFIQFMISNAGRHPDDLGVLRDIDRFRENFADNPIDFFFAEVMFHSPPIGRPPIPNTNTWYQEVNASLVPLLERERSPQDMIGQIQQRLEAELAELL